MLQNWPVGQLLDPQHTPFTQNVETHCSPVLHDAPFGCGVGVRVGVDVGTGVSVSVMVGVDVGAMVQNPGLGWTLHDSPAGQLS